MARSVTELRFDAGGYAPWHQPGHEPGHLAESDTVAQDNCDDELHQQVEDDANRQLKKS